MTVDQYDFWRRRLAGEVLPIHDGECHAGFYRANRKGGYSQPVAIWFTDGKLRCRLGTEDVSEDRAKELWPYVSKHPVSHEAYKAKMETGEWPGEHEAVTRHNNAPNDDSFEGLRDAIEDLAREAETLIKAGPAKSQDEADRASDLANRIGQLFNKADDARKDEKRQYDEAAKAVQTKWAPVLTMAEIYKRVKTAVVTPFLLAKADEERKAREAAVQAGEPAPEIKAAVKAGTRGRSVALRTVKQVEIVDRAALLAHFASGQAMTEFLQSAAERAVRAGVEVPGIKITETKVAA